MKCKTKNLTNKQEKFVHELVKGATQREAYKQSYNACKMKDNTIDRKAYGLFKMDYVRARYDELNGKVVAKAEKGTIATAKEVLQYLTKVQRGEEKEVFVKQNDMTGEMEEIKSSPAIKERTKAAELLGKRYMLFTEKVELSGTIEHNIKLTEEQRDNRIKELKSKLSQK